MQVVAWNSFFHFPIFNAHLSVSFHTDNLPIYCTVEENVENRVLFDCLAIFQQTAVQGNVS